MFEEYKINRKKYRVQWAIIFVVIEGIIILLLLRWLKANYHKRTWNSSTTEGSIYEILDSNKKIASTKTESHSITDINTGQNLTWDKEDYVWLFGKVEIKASNKQKKDRNLIFEITDYIYINTNGIYSYILLKDEVKKGILSKGVLWYIINNNNINIETTIEDLKFLIPDLTLDNKKASLELENTTKRIEESDRSWIINILKDLEKEYYDTINWWNNKDIKDYFAFTETNAFEYIWNQLVIDEDNKYSDIIKWASKKFDIDEDIIRSVIFTEQLRWLTTYRWIFKNLVAWNKYLMVMSQFSYGLWWVKEKSAIEIEDRYKTNNANIYNEIFAYQDSKNIYYQRISRLTSVNDYYYQIMYIAGLLAMYRDQRATEWYNISDKIWILTTLYNIGYKQPNDKPEIWGANIKVNWDSFSFGKLSTSIFYIIKANKYN